MEGNGKSKGVMDDKVVEEIVLLYPLLRMKHASRVHYTLFTLILIKFPMISEVPK